MIVLIERSIFYAAYFESIILLFIYRLTQVCCFLIIMLQFNLSSGQTMVSSAYNICIERSYSSAKIHSDVIDTTFNTIHIFVALCDNKYQGIVPVPAKIGNGQDPKNNLYWGCGYGIKTFFKKSTSWTLIKTYPIDSIRLERLIFKHNTKKFYLIADAYDGQFIKKCTQDFLRSSCGTFKDTASVDQKIIGVAGHSSLLCYIGHNGLMDFQLTETFVNLDGKKRATIVLACYSKRYFKTHLSRALVNPLVWTTGLMAPEAYTVHDAILGYTNRESNENIASRAALAYAKYQKCGEKAARNLLITGW